MRDAHTEHREKQGGPFPGMCVGKLCQARYWGMGRGGMWEERLAEGLAACTKEKKCGISRKTCIPWFLNYLSSSKCWACVEW